MSNDPTPERVCKQCNRSLPLTSYYRGTGCIDGIRPRCKECERERERERYARDPAPRLAQQRQRRIDDPVAAAAATSRWREQNPDKVKERGARYWLQTKHLVRDDRRDYMLRRQYGISLAQRTALIEAQQYRCAICGTTEDEAGRSHAVDHDHRSGSVRGLLCQMCNCTLGAMRDDPALLEAAASYLRAHTAREASNGDQALCQC